MMRKKVLSFLKILNLGLLCSLHLSFFVGFDGFSPDWLRPTDSHAQVLVLVLQQDYYSTSCHWKSSISELNNANLFHFQYIFVSRVLILLCNHYKPKIFVYIVHWVFTREGHCNQHEYFCVNHWQTSFYLKWRDETKWDCCAASWNEGTSSWDMKKTISLSWLITFITMST